MLKIASNLKSITVDIVLYFDYNICLSYDFLQTPSKISLSGHLKLLLVPERTILPPSASILNHPDNKVTFHIKGGSGHFSVKGSDLSIGTVMYNGKRDIVVC